MLASFPGSSKAFQSHHLSHYATGKLKRNLEVLFSWKEAWVQGAWAETNALHGTLLLCPPICAVCNQESVMSQLGQPLSHLSNQLDVLTHVHQALKRKVIRVEVEGQEANVGLQLYGCLDSFSCNCRTVHTVMPSVCGNTLFSTLSLTTHLVSEFVVH